MVMVAQNGHIGSRLKAMVVIPGAWWVGSVCGGITVRRVQTLFSLLMDSSPHELVSSWSGPHMQLDLYMPFGILRKPYCHRVPVHEQCVDVLSLSNA